MKNITKMDEKEFAEFLIEECSEGTSVSNVMHYLSQYTKTLDYFKDRNTGLWATDAPHLVEDPQNVLFQIK